jgi:superfamily I DNA and/or RNA helicase
VVQLVRMLLTSSWSDRFGYTSAMASELILVVTPYNAQIREIERALSHAAIDGVQVGTVDKFQGREAPAVIYSMATSSAADAPRGLEFLFDLHRLNVATSRARAVTFIVASPDLMRVFCSTPRQMQLVNALCRAWEW